MLHSYLRNVLRVIGAPLSAFNGFPILKAVVPREVIVPNEDFEAVYRMAPPWVQLAMLLARDAGLRSQTCLRFTSANCNFETHEIIGRTKAWSTYNVPMTARLERRLRFFCELSYGPEEPLVNILSRGRNPKTQNTMASMLGKLRHRAGIKSAWGMHDLRRTAARQLYEATGDIRKVQRFLGHRGLAQTMWYLGNAGITLTQADVEAIVTNRKELTA